MVSINAVFRRIISDSAFQPNGNELLAMIEWWQKLPFYLNQGRLALNELLRNRDAEVQVVRYGDPPKEEPFSVTVSRSNSTPGSEFVILSGEEFATIGLGYHLLDIAIGGIRYNEVTVKAVGNNAVTGTPEAILSDTTVYYLHESVTERLAREIERLGIDANHLREVASICRKDCRQMLESRDDFASDLPQMDPSDPAAMKGPAYDRDLGRELASVVSQAIWKLVDDVERLKQRSAAPPTVSPVPDFLGLIVDYRAGTVSTDQESVKFGRQLRAWELFTTLYESGTRGRLRGELLTELCGELGPSNLDKWKAALNERLSPLRISVEADGRGLWRLTAF